MMLSVCRTAAASLVLSLLTSACHSPEHAHSAVPLRQLSTSSQCAVSTAKLLQIEDSADATRLMNAHRIGVHPPPLTISDQEQMLLVALGQKPSTGYQLQLEKSVADLRDGVLYLPVTATSPDQGFQAAMITSPCLLLAVTRAPYQRIRVEDLNLELLLEPSEK